MTEIQKFKILFLLFTLHFLFSAASVEAVELFFRTTSQEVGLDSRFKMDILMNTQGEKINAIEGSVVFSRDFLEVKEISDGNSIMNFWAQKPKLFSGNEIVFSGIVPGGYKGGSGKLFSIVFQSLREGNATIGFSGLKALLNDGKGTPAELKIQEYGLKISGDIPSLKSYIPDFRTDIESPETFLPEIASDPNIFKGKWFIVFFTQDKNSGIDHYEISEGGGRFSAAESPYLLKNQNLDQKIFVKAVDKNGNERIEFLPPRNPKTPYKNYAILAILILGILGVFLTAFRKILWKKRAR